MLFVIRSILNWDGVRDLFDPMSLTYFYTYHIIGISSQPGCLIFVVSCLRSKSYYFARETGVNFFKFVLHPYMAIVYTVFIVCMIIDKKFLSVLFINPLNCITFYRVFLSLFFILYIL